jgi:hypothetical protein
MVESKAKGRIEKNEVVLPNKRVVVPGIAALALLAFVLMLHPLSWLVLLIGLVSAFILGIVLTPVFLILFPFLPVLSVANGVRDKISGRYQTPVSTEVIELKKKVGALEDEVHELRRQMILISESADFSTRLVEKFIDGRSNGERLAEKIAVDLSKEP